MPILIVYGIPTETDKKDLEIFSELMRQRTADIEELGIKKEQVSIFFPQDLMSQGLGEEIIIFVEGLFEKPERTNEIKKLLVISLIDQARDSFPKTNLIECLLRSVGSDQIFCSERVEIDESRRGQKYYIKSFN